MLQGLWQRVQNYHAAGLPKSHLNNDVHHRRHLTTILRTFVPDQAELTSRRFVARTSRSMRIGGTTAAATIAPGDFALEYPVPLAPNLQVGIIVPFLKGMLLDCENHFSTCSVTKYHNVRSSYMLTFSFFSFTHHVFAHVRSQNPHLYTSAEL